MDYMSQLMRFPGIHARRLANGGLEMSVVVKGTILGTSQELEMAVDPLGRHIFAPGEMAYTELSRQGAGYQTMQTSATAALVARPTTLTGLELWNGNTTGGPSLVVDRLFSHELVTSTTGLGGGAGIWAMVTMPKSAPSTASLVIVGNSGKPYTGLVIPAVGTTVTANGWFPWGAAVKKESAGAVVPGGQLFADVMGRIVVPPQCSLCVTVVSGYAADTFTSGAAWYEKTFAPVVNPLL